MTYSVLDAWNNRWQVIADNGSLSHLRKATIRLSTVEMPIIGLDYRFESCIFWADGDSEVVARYQTKEEAISGHQSLCKKYDLQDC